MSKITVNFTPEETKKIEIFQARQNLPSRDLTVRKIVEGLCINPGTR